MYHYDLRNKIYFYAGYFFYKIYCFFETKKPKFKLTILNIYWAFINGFGVILDSATNSKLLDIFYSSCNFSYTATKFGKFYIRKKTIDLITVSPCFERADINYLLKLIAEKIRLKKKILFLDVGADIGYYSVVVGNYFNNYKNICILGIEPAKNNRKYLKKNLKENNVKNSRVIPFAMHSTGNVKLPLYVEENATGSNTLNPDLSRKNKEIVLTKTIDSIIPSLGAFDSIIIKMDIEGHEKDALRGAKKTLNSGDVTILVEDFLDKSVISFLEKSNAIFVGKFTNYNSWWKFIKH